MIQTANVKPVTAMIASAAPVPVADTDIALITQDATAFDHVSVNSALQVAAALQSDAHREKFPDCRCVPYEDTFTFHRWFDQGKAPRKGQKALRISSYRRAQHKDKETGEIKEGKLVPYTLCLFCRCQVQDAAK